MTGEPRTKAASLNTLPFPLWVPTAIDFFPVVGWDKAGCGFETKHEAEEAASEQLPGHVKWKVEPCLP